jgi:hypothetical protein
VTEGPSCHRRLRRFWFALSTGLGIGVTAGSEEEARMLAEAARERSHPDATITGVTADVDVRTLDERRVVPHMGPPIVRGVWFPRMNL